MTTKNSTVTENLVNWLTGPLINDWNRFVNDMRLFLSIPAFAMLRAEIKIPPTYLKDAQYQRLINTLRSQRAARWNWWRKVVPILNGIKTNIPISKQKQRLIKVLVKEKVKTAPKTTSSEVNKKIVANLPSLQLIQPLPAKTGEQGYTVPVRGHGVPAGAVYAFPGNIRTGIGEKLPWEVDITQIEQQQTEQPMETDGDQSVDVNQSVLSRPKSADDNTMADIPGRVVEIQDDSDDDVLDLEPLDDEEGIARFLMFDAVLKSTK